MDQANADVGFLLTVAYLRHCVLDQLHRNLLPRVSSDSVRLDGRRHVHLHFRDIAAHAGWHRARSQPGRPCQQSLSRECRSTADSGEEVVYGAGGDRAPGRHTAVRIDFHRDVFHFHVVLGVQDLLCLW